MSEIELLSIIIGGLALLAAGIFTMFNRYRINQTMSRLSQMLELAIDGSFTETTYDESRLSALEVKFNQYLKEALISSKRLGEEKEKIKELISDISHQTKTPIANILLYTQLLSEAELGREEMYTVNQIEAQTSKLSFLIEALIKISRLETGIITVYPKRNDIQELILEVQNQIGPKVRKKNIRFHSYISAPNFMPEQGETAETCAVFDMKWTVEAIYNIVDNAVKYTPDGGNITITGKTYELFYRIDIKDNGIGIPKEEQSRIFSRFYRSAKVASYEGVGIGLFLAREIIVGEGGYIKVTSEEGKGSTFSVFLPIVH